MLILFSLLLKTIILLIVVIIIVIVIVIIVTNALVGKVTGNWIRRWYALEDGILYYSEEADAYCAPMNNTSNNNNNNNNNSNNHHHNSHHHHNNGNGNNKLYGYGNNNSNSNSTKVNRFKGMNSPGSHHPNHNSPGGGHNNGFGRRNVLDGTPVVRCQPLPNQHYNGKTLIGLRIITIEGEWKDLYTTSHADWQSWARYEYYHSALYY